MQVSYYEVMITNIPILLPWRTEKMIIVAADLDGFKNRLNIFKEDSAISMKLPCLKPFPVSVIL